MGWLCRRFDRTEERACQAFRSPEFLVVSFSDLTVFISLILNSLIVAFHDKDDWKMSHNINLLLCPNAHPKQPLGHGERT